MSLLDTQRPVQFLFAGKAHPHGLIVAREVLPQIARPVREPQFGVVSQFA